MIKTSKPSTKPSQLYDDFHPSQSLKETGFKDEKTALKTLNLVSKRSLRYQFDVINTMYNRAKYHPNRTKDMENAMKIFAEWLGNYKKLKKEEDERYPWLDLEIIKKYYIFIL